MHSKIILVKLIPTKKINPKNEKKMFLQAQLTTMYLLSDIPCCCTDYAPSKMSIDAYGPSSQPLTFLDPELDK